MYGSVYGLYLWIDVPESEDWKQILLSSSELG